MKLPDSKYRAIRGWTLGNKINMDIRRQHRARGVDCGCTFTKPFLHSLTIEDYCWTEPVMRNKRGEVVQLAQHVAVPLGKADDFGDVSKADYHTQMWSFGTESIGGFYSYNPPHIERMARWEFVDVLGIISLYDEIAIHENGYRSNTVRIDALWVIRVGQIGLSRRRVQRWLEGTYECPAVVLPEGVVNGFKEWMKRESIETLVKFGGV